MPAMHELALDQIVAIHFPPLTFVRSQFGTCNLAKDHFTWSTMDTSSDNAPIPGPLHLASWLSANSSNLQPPVNNQCLYSGKDFILMAVGGPNTRSDYHSRFSLWQFDIFC